MARLHGLLLICLLILGQCMPVVCAGANPSVPSTHGPRYHDSYLSPYGMGGGLVGIGALIYSFDRLLSTLNNLVKKEGDDKKSQLSLMIGNLYAERYELAKLMAILSGVVLGAKLLWEYGPKLGERIGTGISNIGSRAIDALCNRPGTLSIQQVVMWEGMFKTLMHTLCEQSASGNVMLRSLRAAEQENALDANWMFYQQFIGDTLAHMADNLQTALPHYEPTKGQRAWLVHIANTVTPEDNNNIVFMAKTIVGNIRHIVLVCGQAESMDDLDTTHLKKMAKNTLLLFEKLRQLLGAERTQEKNNLLSHGPMLPGLSGGGGLLEF